MLMFEELENYEIERQLAADYGRGANKSLSMITKIKKELPHSVNFLVKSHKKEVFKSIDLQEAVKAYNFI